MCVDDNEFNLRYRQLLRHLHEAERLVQRVGEDHWATWLAHNRTRIERGDGHGLLSLLQGFGGMGSINDLVLSRLNGHSVDQSEIESLNDQLRRSLHVIHEQALVIGTDADL